MGAWMKLGTKIARSKRSVRGQTVLDEGGLEFALLAMSKDGGCGSSLERGLLVVVYMSIIVTSEHDWELETRGMAGGPQFTSTMPQIGVVKALLPLMCGRVGADVGGANNWKHFRSSWICCKVDANHALSGYTTPCWHRSRAH